MKAKKLPVVYMRPREKPIAWVGMFMQIQGTPRPHLASAYVDAWSSARSAKWLEDHYGFCHSHTVAPPTYIGHLKALQLSKPKGLTPPNAHPNRDSPPRP